MSDEQLRGDCGAPDCNCHPDLCFRAWSRFKRAEEEAAKSPRPKAASTMIPNSCSYCGTTDPADLDWPDPWPMVFVIPATPPIRVCLRCAPKRLTPLAVDAGSIEDSETALAGVTLRYDRVMPTPASS